MSALPATQTPKADKKALILHVAALVCAVWFLLTGWFWAYLVNIVFSYPVALLGLVLWYFGRRADPASRLGRVVIWLLAIGLVVSIGSIFIYR